MQVQVGEIDRVFGGDIINQPRECLVLVDLGQGAIARPVGRPRCAEEHPLAGWVTHSCATALKVSWKGFS